MKRTHHSGETWEKEQETDKNNMPPIRLNDIESGINGMDMRQLLSNENGRNSTKQINDISLCGLIDDIITQLYKDETPYTLSGKKLNRVVFQAYETYKIKVGNIFPTFCSFITSNVRNAMKA